MAKQSQIEKALASLKAERDVLDLAIRKLEAQILPKQLRAMVETEPLHISGKPRASRRRSQGEGATTDSGNMNYPPA